MPNDATMLGGLIGSLLFDESPFWSPMAKICGIIVTLWLSIERVVSGYSSFGQSMVGSLMGIILHYYSTRTPQYLVFVDSCLQSLVALAILSSDHSRYQQGNQHNMFASLIWGIGFDLFICLLLWRHHKISNYSHIKVSLKTISARNYSQYYSKKRDSEEFEVEDDDTNVEVRQHFMKVSDSVWTFGGFLLFLISVFISSGIAKYSW